MTKRFGLSSAMPMPYHEDGEPDFTLFASHGKWCLDKGCSTLTIFGTMGEGASFGIRQRSLALDALAEVGITGDQLVGGIAASSVEQAAEQWVQLADAGVKYVLLLPPHYFKNVSDTGLFRWFSALFEAVGDKARNVILYTIPSVTNVSLSTSLIARLRQAHAGIIAGVKDSTGDWSYAQDLLAEHSDLMILIGDERRLFQAVGQGAQGAISGIANFWPEGLLPLVTGSHDDPRVGTLVNEILKGPAVPRVKAIVAALQNEPAWKRVAAPLSELSDLETESLIEAVRPLLPTP